MGSDQPEGWTLEEIETMDVTTYAMYRNRIVEGYKKSKDWEETGWIPNPRYVPDEERFVFDGF